MQKTLLEFTIRNNRGAMAYGMEEFDKGNPLAWPSFATEADVEGFPPTVISVNECDPLRDEGIEFYRMLLRAGISHCVLDIFEQADFYIAMRARLVERKQRRG